MTNVIACIDGTDVSTAVSDYAAWASQRLDASLVLLHVLEKSDYPIQSDLSGNIGLDSREALLQELAELDAKRGKPALEQGRTMLETARQRAVADGVAEPIVHQRHGSLLDSLVAIEPDTRPLVMGKHDEHLGEHVASRLETVGAYPATADPGLSGRFHIAATRNDRLRRQCYHAQGGRDGCRQSVVPWSALSCGDGRC